MGIVGKDRQLSRGHGQVQGSESSCESQGSGQEEWGAAGTGAHRPSLMKGVFRTAEPDAEDRYRSSIRGASLCRGSLRTPRPDDGGAAGG